MSAAGRPSLFDESQKEFIKYMCETGLTDTQIAEKLGVTPRTFANWKKKHTEFFQSMEDWKLHADREVERSLFQRAKGYTHKEEKAQYDSVSGKWARTVIEKNYAPDTRAAQYWLNNRKPEEYRDKKEVKAEVEHRGVTINFTKAEGTRSLEDIEDE